MGALDRRSVLKGVFAAGAAAAAGAAPAVAREPKTSPSDAVGMLYDATKCIGCKACVVACREANGMPVEPSENGLWDAPEKLSGDTRNIIKVFNEGDHTSFMKAQCMHCVDPGCVSVCMMGAFHKTELDVVAYDASLCIGCRYCQVACPFNIPKLEWRKAAPKIVKCELCRHRLAEGKEPGCTEVCPTGAVIFGKRAELLAEAKNRLAARPELYNGHVYGETEGGGTNVLYLAAKEISFEDLGLPQLDEKAVPHLSESIQHGLYQGFVAPAALYAVLATVMFRNRKKVQAEEEAES